MKCACCGSDAILACSGCKGAPGSGQHYEQVCYCNAACQKADWVNHKPTCIALRNRKTLYRAAETAQLVFYAFCEIIFDISIDRVKEDKNVMYLYEGHYGTYGGRLLMPFPSHLFPQLQDKHAVLSFLTCTEVGYFFEVIDRLFKGTKGRFEEVAVQLKDTPRAIKLVAVNNTEDAVDYDHYLMKITLSNGETYALNIAGAQHGDYEACVPWQQYVDSRIRNLESATYKTFGSLRSMTQQLHYQMHNPGLRQLFELAVQSMSKGMQTCANETECSWTICSSYLSRLLLKSKRPSYDASSMS
ncbi:hypothetical protein LTR66_011803 [Elasticomyces elasticus]|nr:hypothetical protein LTR28_004516 [Elasticomyces elasticus]KAK4968696.1 hypothetical protein LTR66_011803 [Elasticomyces elasticus]KAK4992024.1 hypothetical protein LTR50_001420 [Elasticomyces elasticus]